MCHLSFSVSRAYAQYSEKIQAVDEYCPAPGQFINTMPPYEEGDDAQTMAQKCTTYLASDNPEEQGVVCLGAYGGYITFHFDHPVANIEGQRDFAIFGNSFQTQMFDTLEVKGGASEPGIVMVSQDTNHNGLPDDTWYELSGSADVDSVDNINPSLDWEHQLIYNYQVTYYRNGDLKAIPWTDSRGMTGEVSRMDSQNHTQEYWPLWIKKSQMTFKGTRLPRNAWYVNKGKYKQQWVLFFLKYGYVDNQPNEKVEKCAFDISWAVDPVTRQEVNLTHADFIRVYTAVNQKVVLLGETSTEVAGAKDLHLEASIQAMNKGIVTEITTPVSKSEVLLYQMGNLRIVRCPDGSVRKYVSKR
ncbi:MAG: hypothetical protein IKZ93_02500 [Prevotella sp.]|nr:hypothetical protein [Prevotella sp.]